MKRSLSAWVFALSVGVGSTCHAAMAITDCGQTVPASKRGVLRDDVQCAYRCTDDRSIECTPDSSTCENQGKGICLPDILTLERGAVLELNGHDLVSAWHAPAVFCGTAGDETGRCVVKGPGRILGGTDAIASANLDIVAKNVTLIAEYRGANTNGRVTITDAVLQSYGAAGVRAGSGLKLENVDAGRTEGLTSDGDIELDNVQLGPSSLNRVEAKGSVRGRDVLLRGYASIYGRRVVLRRATSVPSESTGETETLVEGRQRLRLVDSSVSRIVSRKRPRLLRSSCEASFVAGTASSWGVCSSDVVPPGGAGSRLR